jgi:hypothetical protein
MAWKKPHTSGLERSDRWVKAAPSLGKQADCIAKLQGLLPL